MAIRECTRRATDAYNARTYKQFGLKLRLDDDADIIEALHEYKENGIAHREFIRKLFDGQSSQRVYELLQHFPKNQRIEITKNGDMLISGSDPGKHSGAMAKNWILKPNGTLSIEV